MASSDTSSRLIVDIAVDPASAKGAFMRRAIGAVERMASRVAAGDLSDALAAPTDVGTLARLLSRTDLVGQSVTDLDPLAPLLARSAIHRRDLVGEAGGTLSSREAGTLLGISRQAIDKRRRAGKLLAIREDGDWKYPLCQFHDGDVLAGLDVVTSVLADKGPWIILDFLLAKDDVLDGLSPIDALRQGRVDDVARLARASAGDGFA